MKNELHYNNSTLVFSPLTSADLNTYLEMHFATHKKVILTDENVADLWMEHLITSFSELHEAEIIVLPAGEESKSIEICTQVWGALSDYEIGRNDLIINVGGGVITDLGGFIASTYKRGLSFINIPTTLLAQVDASVGGKTGIDLGGYKNQIGVFSDPQRVYIDAGFLSTLPQQELISGYAEMLKHGLIASADYWAKLASLNPLENIENFLDFIYTSVKIKRDIVVIDPTEKGARKTLNFGHTIGHAIEGYCLENQAPIPHGYGVAWGMVAESYIALKLQLINSAAFDEITKKIKTIFPPLNLSVAALPRLFELIKNDKKNDHKGLNFTLINGIGSAVYNQRVETKLVEEAFRFILTPASNHAE